VIGRLHFEDLSTPTRRGLLEVAYASGEPLGVTLVIHETIRTLLGQVDGSGPEDASKLLRLLAGGEDSRVYPLLAFVMKSEDLTEEARPKLVEALQEVGLWGDVSRVMGSFKGHWPLVAPAGVEFDQFAGKVAELEGIDAKNEQAVDAFMEKARAHWQEVHREELGYYRTKDGDVAGPVEQKLMRQFTGEAAHLVQGIQDTRRVQARIDSYREEWMRTPQRTLEGRRPLSAILLERMDRTPGGALARLRVRRTILARTLREIREHLAAGKKRRARAAMVILDELAPDYPPAARARAELEE
jgi:Fe-S-cluster formation regulator IscX/YfhJ